MVSDQLKQQRLLILHLSLIEGIGPVTIAHIVRNKPDHCSWDQLYFFTSADWVALGISQKNASALRASLANTSLLDQELDRIAIHRIQWVALCDDAYPALLKHINYPPSLLYYKGASLDAHPKSISIVGSRAADTYAHRVVELFVPTLVSRGWSIISGGALGVDSMAHHATVAAKGKTVAVLGSGLLRPYPRSNSKLFDQIVESGGTLVSSFGLTVDPIASNFPARNRIIAGLSSGCIVVQAAQKSGASITAQYALDQGRLVFAVPGMIDNPLSVGCHQLLQEGAFVASCVQDILTELGDTDVAVTQQRQSVQQEILFKKPELVKEQQALVAGTYNAVPMSVVSSIGNSRVGTLAAFGPDSIEARIVHFCTRPCSLEDVASHCSLSSVEAQQILFDLQLDGVLYQNFAGQWVCR